MEQISMIQAIEIESEEANKIAERYKETKNVDVICEDFFDFYQRNYKSSQYDLILGNPPYIRYPVLDRRTTKNSV